VLNWQRSRDEIGVKGYIVQRHSGTGSISSTLAQLTETEFEDSDVKKGQTYTYDVIAVDAAGNRSEAATLQVTVPDHPPAFIRQESERYDAAHSSVKRSWFVSNLHGGCWMLYKDLELGPHKPFDQITIRYGTPDDRAGARIKVVLNPALEQADGKPSITGGQQIAEFAVEGTGGWESFKTFTHPVTVEQPGVHTVALIIERGDSKHGNALVNIDWFDIGRAGEMPRE
jgi:hypothetical protein